MRWGTKLTRLERAELRDSFLKTDSFFKTRERNVGNSDVMEIVNAFIKRQPIGQREGLQGGQ